MTALTEGTVALLSATLPGDTAAAIGGLFHRELERFGVRASYIRAYPSHSRSERVYARVSPPGWEAFYAEQALGTVNFLPREVRRRTAPFAWSDIALTDPEEIALSRELAAHGFPDGLAVPCHGAGGYAAVVSLAFEDLSKISPDERAAIELASLVLHERMRALAATRKVVVDLAPFERDVLGFAADGLSDPDIGARLNLSDAEVAYGLRRVRTKLGVKGRRQAIARAIDSGLLDVAKLTGSRAVEPGRALARRLTERFGLTAAEVRLALELFDGATLRQAAERAGRSVNTARVQLSSLFHKTNVHRQPELIKLIADLRDSFD